MAKGNANFNGEIIHINPLRFRVTGAGILRTTLFSKDDVISEVLPEITLEAATNKEPTILANFQQQMIAWEVKTTDINETFNISKVTLFVKVVATGDPQ